MGVWVGGQMYGCLDEWMDGEMERWIDAWFNDSIEYIFAVRGIFSQIALLSNQDSDSMILYVWPY